jgi:phosphate transport system permease protein
VPNKNSARNHPTRTRQQRRHRLRRLEEGIMLLIMRLMIGGAAAILLVILGVIVYRGAGALSWEMLTHAPRGGFYLGGEGGILNAILGSIYLALGATLFAACLAVPLVFFLHTYATRSQLAHSVRLILDVLWGIPSIVYGAFGFAIMIALGMRASLLAGIITVGLVIVPILARTLDEVVRLTPSDLREVTLALGSTRAEWLGVLVRQSLPGLGTALLLAFARGIGDAAAALFTAGFTDRLPDSLFRPVATLPLTVFFLLGTPFPAVQARAYAAGLILTVMILTLSLIGHLAMTRLGRNVIR